MSQHESKRHSKHKKNKDRRNDGFCYPPISHSVEKGNCRYPKYHKSPCYCAQLSIANKYNTSIDSHYEKSCKRITDTSIVSYSFDSPPDSPPPSCSTQTCPSQPISLLAQPPSCPPRPCSPPQPPPCPQPCPPRPCSPCSKPPPCPQPCPSPPRPSPCSKPPSCPQPQPPSCPQPQPPPCPQPCPPRPCSQPCPSPPQPSPCSQPCSCSSCSKQPSCQQPQPPSCPPPSDCNITVGFNNPNVPASIGTMYFNMSTSSLFIFTKIGWVLSTNTILSSGPPPISCSIGQTYFDVRSHIFYIYTQTGWMNTNSAIINSGEGPPSVNGVSIGQLYYDSSTTYTYLWTGLGWSIYMKGLESTDVNGNTILGSNSSTNGGHNTFIGVENQHPAGNNNIALGYNCKFSLGASDSINIGGQSNVCPSNSIVIGNTQTTTHVSGMLLDIRSIYDANGLIPTIHLKGGIFRMLGNCQLPSGANILLEFLGLRIGSTIHLYFKNSTAGTLLVTTSSGDVSILGGDPNIEVLSKQTREVLLVYSGGGNFVVV